MFHDVPRPNHHPIPLHSLGDLRMRCSVSSAIRTPGPQLPPTLSNLRIPARSEPHSAECRTTAAEHVNECRSSCSRLELSWGTRFGFQRSASRCAMWSRPIKHVFCVDRRLLPSSCLTRCCGRLMTMCSGRERGENGSGAIITIWETDRQTHGLQARKREIAAGV